MKSSEANDGRAGILENGTGDGISLVRREKIKRKDGLQLPVYRQN